MAAPLRRSLHLFSARIRRILFIPILGILLPTSACQEPGDTRGTSPQMAEMEIGSLRFNSDGSFKIVQFTDTQDDQDRIWQCRPRTDAYEVNVFNSTGSLERVVEKDFTPIAKTEQELADEKEIVRALIEARMQGQQADFELSPYKVATGLLFFDPRGYIWVQVQRKDAIWGNEFDLLDLEGQWLTTLVLEATTDPSNLVFDGDRVHVVDTNPEDIPKVVIYKVIIGK